MNIDEYLNNLQSSLDSHLSRFGLGDQSSNNGNEPEDQQEIKFCPDCSTELLEKPSTGSPIYGANLDI